MAMPQGTAVPPSLNPEHPGRAGPRRTDGATGHPNRPVRVRTAPYRYAHGGAGRRGYARPTPEWQSSPGHAEQLGPDGALYDRRGK